ncbi:MAG: dehydratase [Anaerolineales bacterium]|nr:dehydratase [Chloroflexota bacterium]MBL6983131.1 dehydratase [Anaerolineales bacterium]
MAKHQARGLYFEEFEVDQVYVSTARTITESDIVAFAGLSGDYNQIHTDVEYGKQTPFGRRIAHGLLITSIASGLLNLSGLIEGTVIAFREIESWKFIKPVFIGDTIHVQSVITKTKAFKRLGSGAVDLELSVLNQNEEVVMKGVFKVLITSKPEEE